MRSHQRWLPTYNSEPTWRCKVSLDFCMQRAKIKPKFTVNSLHGEDIIGGWYVRGGGRGAELRSLIKNWKFVTWLWYLTVQSRSSMKRYHADVAIAAGIQRWLHSLDAVFFKVGIYGHVHGWEKCTNLDDDYAEKEHSSAGNVCMKSYS